MSFANIIRRAAKSYAASTHHSNRPVRRRPVKRSHSQKLRLAERALREVKRRV
ncbi:MULTISPECIES: hypothetical protein [Roseobacteraceae]|uniref:hypothetical protein n=1 Tax=Roseobacteraceae TaxID=2854170 RepID=UPI0012F941DD|nr:MULTISPECIES: hypothetical protein [Roseobacteraceae]MCA0995888.1 hypothetical protein [Alloyangia pacifica]NDV98595.1 hypothetical protein [Salipiger sp. PrR002]NDW57431.1 hypothetical protein [Salipiger sp. PrR004]